MECTKSSTITAFEVLDIASFPADDKSAAAQKAADVKDVYVDDKEVTILTILKCYRILAAFGDALYPRKEVNNVFERLVSTCITQIGTISEEEVSLAFYYQALGHSLLSAQTNISLYSK